MREIPKNMGKKQHDVSPTAKPEMAKRPKDKMNEIIGEIGRWQFQNIAIVFLIGIPGLAHIYSSVFVAAKSDFWCSDEAETSSKDEVTNKSLINHCPETCANGYTFDQSFWTSTLRIQWSLVCERNYLATLAKMTLFSGFGAGTFGAGLISDVRTTNILMT